MRVMVEFVCLETCPEHPDYIENIFPARLQGSPPGEPCANIFTLVMETPPNAEVLLVFGKRIQRCYGCFIAYHLKDMYLGEDVTFFCEHCKDDTMFHFDEFTKVIDISKLKEVADDDHHH